MMNPEQALSYIDVTSVSCMLHRTCAERFHLSSLLHPALLQCPEKHPKNMREATSLPHAFREHITGTAHRGFHHNNRSVQENNNFSPLRA
jgi:hypothetical protein